MLPISETGTVLLSESVDTPEVNVMLADRFIIGFSCLECPAIKPIQHCPRTLHVAPPNYPPDCPGTARSWSGREVEQSRTRPETIDRDQIDNRLGNRS